jgi:hypothetical protein
MPVKRSLLACVVLGFGGCGPEAKPELADASWVLGRYSHGEGCTLKGVDQDGTPVVEGWIVDCTTQWYAEVEFFADGRVESDFFRCHDDDTPYLTERSRWRATEVEGEVVVEPESGKLGLLTAEQVMRSATVRRTEDCSQIFAEQNDDEADERSLVYAILHRGVFQWVDLLPSDGCEETAQPLSAPECPDDDDEE